MYEPSISHSTPVQSSHRNDGADVAMPVIAEPSALLDMLASTPLGAKRITLAPGKMLFEAHSEARSLFFVNRGQVRTYRIEEQLHSRLLEILGPGDWCGEAALARLPQYGEEAVAVVTSVVTEVPAERLFQFLPRHPKAAIDLMKQLACRLTAARADSVAVIFDDCHARLVKTLVRLSSSVAAQPHPEGVVLRMTHQQLAQAVGVARETVSTLLNQLRQQNVLRTGRNQILFNPEHLRAATRVAQE